MPEKPFFSSRTHTHTKRCELQHDLSHFFSRLNHSNTFYCHCNSDTLYSVTTHYFIWMFNITCRRRKSEEFLFLIENTDAVVVFFHVNIVDQLNRSLGSWIDFLPKKKDNFPFHWPQDCLFFPFNAQLFHDRFPFMILYSLLAINRKSELQCEKCKVA